MLGRLSGSKRPDWAMKILSRVHASLPQIRLHIVGVPPHQLSDLAEFQSVMSAWRAESSWVAVHEDLSRESLAALVANQRYGVHAIEDEHFGMAVAEMVSAGCLPFVHNSGGPPDIVGQDARLLYGSIDEAVEKISHVLSHPAEQLEIRSRMEPRRNAFTPEIFMTAIRREVARALGRPDS